MIFKASLMRAALVFTCFFNALSAHQTVTCLGTAGQAVYGLSLFRDSSFRNGGFYLASSDNAQTKFSISQTTLQERVISEGADDYHIRKELTLNPLVVSNAVINNDDVEGNKTQLVANPLYNNTFTCLDRYETLFGSPVVVPADNQQQLYLVEGLAQLPDSEGGTAYNRIMRFLPGTTLKDASGTGNATIYQIAAPISVTSGVSGSIFAAVGVNDTLALAGIKPVFSSNKETGAVKGLVPFDLVNGAAGNASYPLKNDIGFSSQVLSLYWDETTSRLYCGLKTGDMTNGGGVLGVWVIRFSPTVGYTQVGGVVPFIAPGVLPPDDKSIGQSGILGVGVNFEINKMMTLHASTGKSYLIVQGGRHVPLSPENTQRVGIWAFPIIKTSDTASEVGVAAVDTNNTSVATGFPAAAIHDLANNLTCLPDFDADELEISDICVGGDTVIIGVRRVDPTSDTGLSQTGVFAKTALFDSAGYIRDWSGWKRLSYFKDTSHGDIGTRSLTGDVHAVGYDSLTDRLWAVVGADRNSVVVNDWEKDTSQTSLTSEVMYSIGSPSEQLQLTIGKNFPEGVFGVGSIDLTGYTSPASRVVALGGDGHLTIFQTSDVNGDPVYDTTQVKAYTNLSDLGLIHTICTVDNSTTNRWIILGGTKGLGVIAQADGSGFSGSSAWLTQISTMDVRIFTELTDIKKVAFDPENQRILVLAPKKLYAIDAAEDKFQETSPTDLSPTLLYSITDLSGAAAYDEFLSFLVFGGNNTGTQPRFFAGTTRGLYHKLSTDSGWTAVTSGVVGSLGPVRALQSIVANDVDINGNLYALVSARSRDRGLVYRFDVTGSDVLQITEPTGRDYLVNIGTSRESFLLDSGHLYHAHVPFQTATDYLRHMYLRYSSTGARTDFSDSYDPVNYNRLPTRLGQFSRVAGWDSLVLATDWGLSVRD